MKKGWMYLLLVAAIACNSEAGYKKAEDAQEAAREFIRACLDGNTDKANFYMFKDSADANTMLLNKWKTDYDKRPNEEKVALKNANIIVINSATINDSTIDFTFSNSFKNTDTTTIRILRLNKEWLVDLEHLH
jgi:hypothetical protein